MQSIREFVTNALKEDLGRGDLFSRCAKPKQVVAQVKTKQDGIFAGEVYAKELLKLVETNFTFKKKDGEKIQKGDILLEIKDTQIAILSFERTLMNILQHASGIATLTNKYAKILEDTPIKILDTRKTRPLLRIFEKYATRVGGITNHRMGLDDSLMLNETHLKTIEDLDEFVKNARKNIPITTLIEIECETIEMAKKILRSGADILMCDGMKIEEIREVVKLRNELSPNTKIEATGNITLETIKNYKNIGIDQVSTGSVIHQATWIDFSIRTID